MRPTVRAALLTPAGRGGITVVAVVGPGALRAVWRRFRPKSGVTGGQARPGKLYYGHFTDGRGEPIDEVLVAVLSAEPEQVEVNCHGGIVPSQLVLRELAGLGVEVISWAQLPPEAHLTPGADLIQREAHQALVHAPTARAAEMLTAQWAGALSREVRSVLRRVRSEHSEDGLTGCAEAIEELLATARWGLALTEPPKVVLGGRVNVGKSSLANALHQAERFLVDEQAGTTRDLLPGLISVDGLPVELIDAAGIRETEDTVEKLAVEHSRRGIREAQLVVVVLDGSRELVQEEREFIAWLEDQPILVVANKADLPHLLSDEEVVELTGVTPVHTSAVTGGGLDRLRSELSRRLFVQLPEDTTGPVVFTRRQVALLTRARDALEAAGAEGADQAVTALKALLG